MVDPVKIGVILNLEAPRSVKQLRDTLGHTGYYRKFIKNYAQITALLKTKQVNIGMEAELKFAKIGDHWDDVTMDKVDELLHEY